MVVTMSVLPILQAKSLMIVIAAILSFPIMLIPASTYALHDFGSAFPYAILYGVLGGGFVVWRVRKRIDWKGPLATLRDLPTLSLLFGLTGNWAYGVLGLLLSLTAIGLGLAALVRWKLTGNLYRLSACAGIGFGILGIWWFLLPYYMFGWHLETGRMHQ